MKKAHAVMKQQEGVASEENLRLLTLKRQKSRVKDFVYLTYINAIYILPRCPICVSEKAF
jgi:hypothetical protein